MNGGILWANLHLLFWLSLFPFVTTWMGEPHFASGPAAAYGFVGLMAAVAYYVLQTLIVRVDGRDRASRRRWATTARASSRPSSTPPASRSRCS